MTYFRLNWSFTPDNTTVYYTITEEQGPEMPSDFSSWPSGNQYFSSYSAADSEVARAIRQMRRGVTIYLNGRFMIST